MSRMKDFAMEISERLGFSGELEPEVLEYGTKILEKKPNIISAKKIKSLQQVEELAYTLQKYMPSKGK